MACEESSVTASLTQLKHEEERRRAELVVLAQRRKLEQEREALVEQARISEQQRLRVEAATREANRRADQERAEHERLDRERIVELERVRAELELRTKVAVMQLEQEQEAARLRLVRDAKVVRLEGQRSLLLALLVTLTVGAGVIYALLLRPAALRLEEDLSLQTRINLEQRAEREKERAGVAFQVGDLEQRLSDTSAKLAEANRRLEASGTRLVRSPPVRALPRPPRGEAACVDPNDPLCGHLGG
jgi:hypothetical protein